MGHGIIVGIDGSEEARWALRWAAEEAMLRGAPLSVVHAWPGPYRIPEGPNVQMGPEFNQNVSSTERRLAEELVERELDAIEEQSAGLRINRVVLQGPTVPTLLAAATEAELLVVGTRGLGGFKGLLLGSVSQQCAQHAPCPVVIVHSGDR